jgi:hypothetical protein
MNRFSDVLPGILIALVVVIGALFFWQKQGGFMGNNLNDAGDNIKEQRNIGEFKKISLNGHGTIMLEQGEKESLEVEASENLMEYILTEVRGDELIISYKNIPSGLRSFSVKYYITVKELENIDILGSGKVDSSTITSSEIELLIDGSGNMSMSLDTKKLLATIKGSGKYELSGSAEQQEINISGSGKFFGSELVGNEGEVDIDGSGKVEINTKEKLDVIIGGSGSVYYLGDPTMSTVDISGSGKIEKL